MPFDYHRGDDARCAECLQKPPRHSGIRAAVAYGNVARVLALRLKYARRTGFAETMAALMVRLVPDNADLLVPVPLHRWRLWSRGFNQAALIAQALARRRQLSVAPLALTRVRKTPVLRGLGARSRAEALKGAIAVVRPDAVRGRAVVLIDDVYTSGATTDACTHALLKAGASSVHILCWARVLSADPGD